MSYLESLDVKSISEQLNIVASTITTQYTRAKNA